MSYPIETVRHSLAHVLAAAVQKLFPDVKIDDTLKEKLNEIALIVYLYESKNGMKDHFIIDRASQCGWLLNYELFFNDLITEEVFAKNLESKNIKSYRQLKERKIHFYIKES